MNSKIYIGIAIVLFTGCKNSFDEPIVSAGNADFSRFVSIGGYYTAGFGDGALHYDLQQHSFPAILASRFAMVGGGEFRQPMVNPGPGLGFSFIGQDTVSKWSLSIETDCAGVQRIVRRRGAGDISNFSWIGNAGPYNNLGVPGAKVFNLDDEYFGQEGNPKVNQYFNRFASDPATSSTILYDASLINPTFFTLWIGTEDIWQYARSGGQGDFTDDTLSIEPNDITPVSKYARSFQLAVNNLVSNDVKGALANLPDIDCIPYFTAIPYNGLVLTQAQADNLNASSVGYNFKAGPNPFVISVPNTSIPRQITSDEFILLSIPYDSITCYGLGTPQNPIPSYYVLDGAEVANIKQATAMYNYTIDSIARSNNLAHVNINALFRQLKNNYTINGVSYNTSDYLKNTLFSIDGLYPNARGYAYIANAFIRAINEKYLSTLPEVDVNAYKGTSLP